MIATVTIFWQRLGIFYQNHWAISTKSGRYNAINTAVDCSTYLTTLSDFSSFVVAEGSYTLLIYRRLCDPGGGDLLPRQPVPGPSDNLGRRLD